MADLRAFPFVLLNDTWAQAAHKSDHPFPVLPQGLPLAVVEAGEWDNDNRCLRVMDSDANEFFILEVQA